MRLARSRLGGSVHVLVETEGLARRVVDLAGSQGLRHDPSGLREVAVVVLDALALLEGRSPDHLALRAAPHEARALDHLAHLAHRHLRQSEPVARGAQDGVELLEALELPVAVLEQAPDERPLVATLSERDDADSASGLARAQP